MTTRGYNFFSFSSLRWWGQPKKKVQSQWTWGRIAALKVIDKDLTRGDSREPRRIERVATTASHDFVRVSRRCTVEGND